jgi:nucleoside-diphosphate-sugar epimerase
MSPEKSKRVVINGANGFLGSHLVAKFLGEGYQVVALARRDESLAAPERVERALAEVFKAGGKSLEDYRHQLRVVEAGVNHPNPEALARQINSQFQDLNPGEKVVIDELILNAASTRLEKKYWKELKATNVEGTKNMLKMAQHLNIRRVVQIGTSYDQKGLKDASQQTLTEESELGQGNFLNPYALSKYAARQIFTKWCREHNLPGVVIKPTIIQGKGAEFGLVPFFDFVKDLRPIIQRVLGKNRLLIPGDPEAILDMVRVEDVVDNTWKVLQALKPEAGKVEVYQLGRGSESLRYRDLVRLMLLAGGVINEQNAETEMAKIKYLPKEQVQGGEIGGIAGRFWGLLGLSYQPMIYWTNEFSTGKVEELLGGGSIEGGYQTRPIDLEYIQAMMADQGPRRVEGQVGGPSLKEG